MLGSLNLNEFVINPFTDTAKIDYEGLEKATRIAIRALNEVLLEGLPLHPLQEQRDSVSEWRQIGLGTLGLADFLIKLGVTYGSEISLGIIDTVYKTIATTAVLESLELAKEKGCYPKCKKELLPKSNFIQALNLPKEVLKEIEKYGLFNSQLLTCAPTGTIGTLLSTSTGVEPNFAWQFLRKTQSLEGKDVFYEVGAKIVEDFLKINPQYTKDTLPEYFVSSAEINSLDRIKVQQALQKWIDASISSTINLPKEATIEEVYDIYLYAWKHNLKGVTIYRSGCKREGVLITEPLETSKSPELSTFMTTFAPKRPKKLIADFYCVKAKGEQFIVLVGLYEGKPYEVFAFRPNIVLSLNQHEGYITKKSKMHYSFTSPLLEIKDLESINDDIEEKATTLYTSMLLRHGAPIKYITKTMRKVNDNIISFSSALCRVLSKYIPTETTDSSEKCPECGGKMIIEGGCSHCESCGYSKCN